MNIPEDARPGVSAEGDGGVSQLDHVYRLIDAGVFSYPGGGLDYRAAESAIAGAIRLDALESNAEGSSVVSAGVEASGGAGEAQGTSHEPDCDPRQTGCCSCAGEAQEG